MHAYADPQDANTVWVLNLNCCAQLTLARRSTASHPHGDNHGLWIDRAIRIA